jgi:hypothetical protein
MAETVVLQDDLIATVITQLNADLVFSVGDGQAPDSPSPAYPYAVVYSLDDAERTGPMQDGQADVTHNVQVTTVGELPVQARKLMDFVRVSIKTNLLAADAIPNRHINLIEHEAGGLTEKDESDQPPLFYTVDIFRIMTTPS